MITALAGGFPWTGSARRRPLLRLLIPLLILWGTGACVSTKATMISPTAMRLAPLQPQQVQIFTTQAELDTLDYVRVAIIEATGSGEFTSQTGMIEAMRKKAAALGANGILMPQIQEPGAGAKVAAAVLGVGTQRKGQVIALYVRGPRKRSPSSPDP